MYNLLYELEIHNKITQIYEIKDFSNFFCLDKFNKSNNY